MNDLGFKRNRHYWIFVEKWDKKFSSEKAFKIFFAIRFTGPKVDRIADDLKIKGDLDNGNIRYQFNRHMQKEFSAFDAR